MDFALTLFYAFGLILLASAGLVVIVRNPVHAALWLVLSFFTAAALWLLLYAEFLAITLVLVYVGAVMVLFLFVVMMLDINIDLLREGFWKHLPIALVVGLLMAIELMLLAVNMNFIAFAHQLGDLSGQVFVFFILTVAAAESAIGLAILVALFRNLRSINVDDLGSLKG